MSRPNQSRRFVAAGLISMLATYVGQHDAYGGEQPVGHVTVVSQNDGAARLLFSARGLPGAVTVDPSLVRVDIDGQPAAVQASSASTVSSGSVARRVVLVFDTSGSMAGAGIAGARQAALAFAASVPADVRVGLVAFSDRPQEVLAPTLSRPALRAAVDRLQAGGETALYDGVNLGLRVLGMTGERALTVLSDGADTRSSESLSSVAAHLKRARVRMDAVAFHTPDAVSASLQRLATASGGKVTAASNAAGLASAFTAAARTFASDLVLNVNVPARDLGRTVPVTVTVGSTAGTLKASTSLQVAGAPTRTGGYRSDPLDTSPKPVPVSLLLLIFAAVLVPLLALLVAFEKARSPQVRTKRLLTRYTLRREHPVQQETAAPPTGINRVAARLTAFTDKVASDPVRREKLLMRLTRADVSMSPGEWIAVQCLVSFAMGALGTLIFGSLIAGLLCALIGSLASRGWLSLKGGRRLRAFDEHLPSALQLVASSLRSGFSLAQALDGVVREGVEPIAGELNRALAEARLGMTIEDALDGISERMSSNDWSWVVMAIRIQREVGGNLAEILLTTAGVMRDRGRLRRQVKALSAEGRLSAYVLLALPVLMALYMFMLRRTYIHPLYTTGFGIAMLVFAVVMLVIGTLWMRKVVTVEV